MIEVSEQINAVRRQVGSRTLEAGEARVVTISQAYRASLDDVWDACTNPERIPRWFLPVSGDLQLNGRYELTGNASGTIQRCDPPHGFAATWEYGGDTSWIEVHLSPEPADRTRFTLEHIAHVDDERWAEYGPGAVGIGWDLGLLGLAGYLSPEGGRVDPKDGPAWVASEEGRQFMSASSERWYEASVAAGTPQPDARAAADRTTAAYTATPETAQT
jgi:uncharacterized protein YndB with AHSA1/START domain